MRPREALNAQNVTQIGSQGTPRAKVRVAVFEGFGRRDDPRLIWSQFEASQVFSKKKSQFFWRVDTPLQVFPVHTPVRRGQSGTLSGSHVVPGQLRRDFALPMTVFVVSPPLPHTTRSTTGRNVA